MKRPSLLIGAIAVVAFSANGAIAGGMAPATTEPEVFAPAAVVPAYNWTGGYAGFQLGGIDSSMDTQFLSPPAPDPWRGEPDPSGVIAGLYGGYNWQGNGPWVFGLEGEVNWSNADGTGGEFLPAGPTDWSYTADINNTAALRARVGYATGRTLFYAAGGLAYVDYDLGYFDSAGGLRDTISDSQTGWTLGIGVEYAFQNNWVGRIDYRYSDFGSNQVNINEGSGVFPADIDLKTHEVRLGIAMRF